MGKRGNGGERGKEKLAPQFSAVRTSRSKSATLSMTQYQKWGVMPLSVSSTGY